MFQRKAEKERKKEITNTYIKIFLKTKAEKERNLKVGQNML